MKTICPIHHFSYSGSVCPFCEKERLDRLATRFVKEEDRRKPLKEKEITENDIQKLLNKFNKK